LVLCWVLLLVLLPLLHLLVLLPLMVLLPDLGRHPLPAAPLHRRGMEIGSLRLVPSDTLFFRVWH
jgi:hypothetical protein